MANDRMQFMLPKRASVAGACQLSAPPSPARAAGLLMPSSCATGPRTSALVTHDFSVSPSCSSVRNKFLIGANHQKIKQTYLDTKIELPDVQDSRDHVKEAVPRLPVNIDLKRDQLESA